MDDIRNTLIEQKMEYDRADVILKEQTQTVWQRNSDYESTREQFQVITKRMDSNFDEIC
jgi:hypothetical protein